MLTDRQLKIQAFKIAVKNPTLAKLFKDAIKSPIGSTARDKARNVLESLHVSQRNKVQASTGMFQPDGAPTLTGMGGPVDKKKVTIFLRPITKAYSFEIAPPNEGQGGQHDGQGGDLSYSSTYDNGGSRVGDFFSGLWGGAKNLYSGYQQTKEDLNKGFNQVIGSGATALGKTAASLAVAGPTLAEYMVSPSRPASLGDTAGGKLLNLMWPQGTGPNSASAGPATTGPGATVGYGDLVNDVATGTIYNTKSGKGYGSREELARDLGIGANDIQWTQIAQSLPAGADGASSEMSSAAYGPPGPGSAEYTDNQTKANEEAMNNASPLTKYLLQSYGEGMGSNAFALGVMSDVNKLQELFPGVPVDKLPVGASLAGQLNDLQDKLMGEYKVNELRDSLMGSINRGATLTEDTQAYIRGKDEFLNSVNDLLERANTTYIDSSLRSDPFYAKSMDNYINYLSILKGRTTQRYIDYVNTAINYQNAQQTQLQNAYNSAADRVSQIFTQEAALTTEQYNSTKQTLMEMYDNVAKRAELQDTTSQAYMDRMTSYYGMLGAAADASIKTQEAARGGKVTKVSESDLKTLSEQLRGVSNPLDALNNPLAISNGYAPDLVFDQFAKQRADSIASSIRDSGNIATLWATDKGAINDLVSSDPNSLGLSDFGGSSVSYVDAVNKGYNQGIKDYVNAHLDDIKKLLEEMKGNTSYESFKAGKHGLFGWGGNNYDDYVKGKVSDEFAQFLFKGMQTRQQLGQPVNLSDPDDIASMVYGAVN